MLNLQVTLPAKVLGKGWLTVSLLELNISKSQFVVLLYGRDLMT